MELSTDNHEPGPDPSPSLIVDDQFQILHLGAGAERLLQMPSGAPSYQLFEVLHPELRETARATLARAATRGRPAEGPGVSLNLGGTTVLATCVARPLAGEGGAAARLLVTFDLVQAGQPGDGAAPPLSPAEHSLSSQLAAYERRYVLTRARHEVAIEELRTTNEELHIVNEELKSSTEELEWRREELQKLNEELRAINAEQRQTLAELAQAKADLENLIASTDSGTLFLDRALRVKRFTPQLLSLFNLIAADIGRPLAHITHRLHFPELLADAQRLLGGLVFAEREVQHEDGRWFLVRLRPYRTADQQIDGVVLSFVDISVRKQAEESLRQAHAALEQRVQERTAELVQAQTSRTRLLRELVQAQEGERRRIARDLHDQFGQQITAILLGLRALAAQAEGRSEQLDQLEHLRGIVQAMGRDLHQMALELRPTALDDVGLAAALQGHAERWARRTGIAIETFLGGFEALSLPPEIETTLYRVALEALTNVVRHAGATRVSLVLERHGSAIILVVEDNGRGFEGEATLPNAGQSEHIGLLGMHERVALVGGTLTIESALGSGTAVIARVPLAGP